MFPKHVTVSPHLLTGLTVFTSLSDCVVPVQACVFDYSCVSEFVGLTVLSHFEPQQVCACLDPRRCLT